MPFSQISTILGSLEKLNDPVHVSGATPAAQAWLVTRLAREASRSVLVLLCPNDEAAAEFHSDLESLGGITVPSTRQINLRYCLYTSWEQSPYSPVASSIRTRLCRTSLLNHLAHAPPTQQESMIIVTSLPALCQATMPPEIFKKYSIPLEIDNSVESREALIHRLTESGYFRVDPVEDPGTFAVRGDIIDLYPLACTHPFRIELFGDVIERIRRFDPKTQRTLAADLSLQEIVVPPAREVLVNSETSPRIREQVKYHSDHVGITRATRDPILEALRAGHYPEHCDAWAPFAYEHHCCLWDFLPQQSLVIWNDAPACERNWDSFLGDQQRLADDAVKRGQIMPSVESLYTWNPLLEAQIKKASRLYLDRLNLDDLKTVQDPNSRHRVLVTGNQGLHRYDQPSMAEIVPLIRSWIEQRIQIWILTATQSQLERIRFLFEERGLRSGIHFSSRPGLSAGFQWPSEGIVVITESEILGSKRNVRPQKGNSAQMGLKEWSSLQTLSDLTVGDAIVHVDHGIGKYQGLVRLNLSGAPSDFVLLEYANKDKLYLPVYRLNLVQKYVGSAESIGLDRLGSQQFQRAKERVREVVRKLAINLVQLYAERRVRAGIRFSPPDAMFREFEASFLFDETVDQLKAIDQVLTDLTSGRVMDRLVCGDVGYGKTEIAMRAAFCAISDGKQVAVLVPTTILALQHEQTFRNRFKDYPMSIDSVSRLKPSKDQKQILGDLASGKLDLIIGTHRLLSKDVKFRNLGLVIIDEEHRFGVEHKERLKTLKINTHVLTLTATPIPRTLHMALSGLRDISLINTPPIDRLPIRTFISKFDESLIQRSIEFELSRGGQVFFLHNRVQTIHEIAGRIRELVPSAIVAIAHGQMADGELEEIMLSFFNRKTNVLVCTTIIESGLDLPSANTILINRADTLGLAQLYQIRGRVGRSQQRAYAYLLVPSETAINDEAKKRLEVIQRFVELGSGFSVASHDLEIRGGGELLGPQQSGYIAAVGFDLYTELLEEAVREIEGASPVQSDSREDPEIKTPFPSYLADDYVPDVHQRLSFYRRLSGAGDDAQLEIMEIELRDRFGPLPLEAQNLLWIIRIKILLKKMGAASLTVGAERISIAPGHYGKLSPTKIMELIAASPEKRYLTSDSKLVVSVAARSLQELYCYVERLLRELSEG